MIEVLFASDSDLRVNVAVHVWTRPARANTLAVIVDVRPATSSF